MATIVERQISFQRGQDMTELTRHMRISGVTGTLAQQLAQATALLPAIGATYYSSTVKAYSWALQRLDKGEAQIDVYYRTAQPDDLITTSASGAIIDKGSNTSVEDVLRIRHPTSGAPFTLGTSTTLSIARIRQLEPRIQYWWDKVHDSVTKMDADNRALSGSINAATWLGDPAGTWLCMGADTRSVFMDSGSRYVARYTFAYKPETWVAYEWQLVYNSLSLGSITTATAATAALTTFKSASFNGYGFTR